MPPDRSTKTTDCSNKTRKLVVVANHRSTNIACITASFDKAYTLVNEKKRRQKQTTARKNSIIFGCLFEYLFLSPHPCTKEKGRTFEQVAVWIDTSLHFPSASLSSSGLVHHQRTAAKVLSDINTHTHTHTTQPIKHDAPRSQPSPSCFDCHRRTDQSRNERSKSHNNYNNINHNFIWSVEDWTKEFIAVRWYRIRHFEPTGQEERRWKFQEPQQHRQ
mmetsp:Transcript_32823/g.79790  ORF Transcript_32823/g.79790 Transcript_32823/m.79790 type:complete len:218 (+) Transcript_32823:328-981(+)